MAPPPQSVGDATWCASDKETRSALVLQSWLSPAPVVYSYLLFIFPLFEPQVSTAQRPSRGGGTRRRRTFFLPRCRWPCGPSVKESSRRQPLSPGTEPWGCPECQAGVRRWPSLAGDALAPQGGSNKRLSGQRSGCGSLFGWCSGGPSPGRTPCGPLSREGELSGPGHLLDSPALPDSLCGCVC